MKRITAIILSIVLLLSMLTVTVAAAADGEHQAKNLKTLGLFQGVSDTDFALERQPTRTEALVMLIRAMGKEAEAKNGSWKHPFTDVAEWANSYVGYAYEKGLTKGVSDKLFGANDTATCQMYLTFMLRALGYSDTNNQDFSWSDPYTLAKKAGILDNTIDQKGFLRADVAKVSWLALSAKLKGSKQTLAEKLIADGVFTSEAYKSVGGVVAVGELTLSWETIVDAKPGSGIGASDNVPITVKFNGEKISDYTVEFEYPSLVTGIINGDGTLSIDFTGAPYIIFFTITYNGNEYEFRLDPGPGSVRPDESVLKLESSDTTNVNEDAGTGRITVRFNDETFVSGSKIGTGGPSHVIGVAYDGYPVQNYTFEISDTTVITGERIADGLKISNVGNGVATIKITCQGETASFLWDAAPPVN